MQTRDALALAEELELDLVEIAPTSRPPVCRIMDYGKWKYQQKKKEQKARSHATKSELKGIRLRPKIDDHDLDIKLDKAREFLIDTNKVQFTMLFRGREMAHQDLGLRSMREICDKLADVSKVESPPRIMGRRMTMLLAPDRKSKQEPNERPAQQQQPAQQAGAGA
jgi:translation initiation factor IF-3